MSLPDPTPPTLLIVDDNHPLCQMLAWAFEDLGYLAWTATTLYDARASAAAMRFDYALLDYHLPDGSGSCLARELSSRQPAIRTMLMSADVSALERLAGLRASTGSRVGIVGKPLRPGIVSDWFRETASDPPLAVGQCLF